MPNDILIYGRIDEWNARSFFQSISDAQEDGEETALTFRINTGGGEPEYGWGMCSKINEIVNKKALVDGKAYSMGLFACCYIDEVSCHDVSQFMVHRAGYSEWFEKSEYFTEPLQENLANINKNLEKAFRNKIDVEAFENLKQVKEKGITVKDIFSMDGRIDVFFSAQDAKKIGLVKNIIKLTPEKKAEISAFEESVNASREGKKVNKYEVVTVDEPKEDEPKNTNMTADEIKAKYPAAHAEILNSGVAAERDRVESIMVFADVDMAECKKAIESGKPLTAKQMAELSRKSMNAEVLTKVKDDSKGEVKTEAAKEDAEKGGEKAEAVKNFEADLDKRLGIKKAS